MSKRRLLVYLATAVATAAPAAASAAVPGPGMTYAAAERARLTHEWGRYWNLLHPGQRRFIGRARFVACFRRQRAPLMRPQSIRVLGVQAVRTRVAGVTAGRVPARTVRIRVDYGPRAPSQVLTGTLVSVGGRWYWTTPAATAKQFLRLNFCG